MRHSHPKILMAISMTIFGTLPVFVRNIPLSSAEIALYRAVLAAMLTGAYLAVTKKRIVFKNIRSELPIILISGAAMGINWILLFESYRFTSVSIATLSYYFAPVIVTAVSPFLFHERLTAKQIICFAMSTTGVIMITGVGGISGDSDLKGIALGLSAAVFYAAVILLNKRIKTVDGINRTFIQFVAAAAVLLPYTAVTGGFNLLSLDMSGTMNLLTVGLFHTGITYCLYFSSITGITGQQAAVLSYIDPLVAVVMSVTVLGESITPLQTVGGLMILGFTLLNEVRIKTNRT